MQDVDPAIEVGISVVVMFCCSKTIADKYDGGLPKLCQKKIKIYF